MTQIMIGDDAGNHRLPDRYRANADTGVVPALGDDLGLAAVAVDRPPRRQDRGGRLHRKAADDRLPGGNAAEDAASLVGKEAQRAVVTTAHLVGILLAAELGGVKAGADLHALDGIDAHQRCRKVAVELAVDRGAEACRHALSHHFDDGADRGALLAHLVEVSGKFGDGSRVGAEQRIARDLIPVPVRAIDPLRADLDQGTAHDETRHDSARDGAGCNAGCGLARRGPPAATIVPHAILDVVGVVGMAGTVFVADCGIVLGALIDILDQQGDRRAGRDLAAGRIREDAGQHPHRVGFLPLGGEAGLPGPPTVEVALDVGRGKRDAGRAAVDHATDRRPMAFAKGRDAKAMAEGIVGHAGRLERIPFCRNSEFALSLFE
jgi:hypothetical protein